MREGNHAGIDVAPLSGEKIARARGQGETRTAERREWAAMPCHPLALGFCRDQTPKWTQNLAQITRHMAKKFGLFASINGKYTDIPQEFIGNLPGRGRCQHGTMQCQF